MNAIIKALLQSLVEKKAPSFDTIFSQYPVFRLETI